MALKYRIYKANKQDKMLKHKTKLQKHYNDNHVVGTPIVVSLPIVTYEGKYALTYLEGTLIDNDSDDGLIDPADLYVYPPEE